jgi:predicted thioesterase
MLTPSQSALVAQTLRAALGSAADEAHESMAAPLEQAAAAIPSATGDAHPALPDIGDVVSRDLVVSADDTAAAMGHPDASVQVLGTPRISLWFELVSCELLPDPADDLSHVGVGVLVHHLGRADIGETVTVESTCAAAAGRRVVFSCRASIGDRVVALGVHQRSLLVPR